MKALEAIELFQHVSTTAVNVATDYCRVVASNDSAARARIIHEEQLAIQYLLKQADTFTVFACKYAAKQIPIWVGYGTTWLRQHSAVVAGEMLDAALEKSRGSSAFT